MKVIHQELHQNKNKDKKLNIRMIKQIQITLKNQRNNNLNNRKLSKLLEDKLRNNNIIKYILNKNNKHPKEENYHMQSELINQR